MCTADSLQQQSGNFSLAVKLVLGHSQLLFSLKHDETCRINKKSLLNASTLKCELKRLW